MFGVSSKGDTGIESFKTLLIYSREQSFGTSCQAISIDTIDTLRSEIGLGIFNDILWSKIALVVESF